MNRTIRIRTAAFETNSSSTHSITVAKGSYIPDRGLRPNDFGEIEIFTGEFGWGFDEFDNVSTKAAYILTWLRGAKENNYVPQDILDEAEKMFIKVLLRVTGATSVVFVEETKWSYIDHQSIESGGGTGREVFKTEKTLEQFLFNPKSVLTIDNDNH